MFSLAIVCSFTLNILMHSINWWNSHALSVGHRLLLHVVAPEKSRFFLRTECNVHLTNRLTCTASNFHIISSTFNFAI